MRKLLVLFGLVLISIFSYSEMREKTGEEILEGMREKIAQREQEKIRQQEEEARKEQEKKELAEKEAMKMLLEKRREYTTEPLEEKYVRGNGKAEVTDRAMEIAEGRISFVRVKEQNRGETEDTLSTRYDKAYSEYEKNSKEMQEVLEEREELQKQLRELEVKEARLKN